MDKTGTTGERRLHGRKKGHRLRPYRQQLIAERLPDLRVPVNAAALAAPRRLFPHQPEEVWLEIGFGAGEHLAAQAREHPDVGFIGCEPFVNGVASLLALIDRHKLTNIRIHDCDARDLLEHLGAATLGRVFVLFPDPWPKRRHRKRRLVNAELLDRLAHAMRRGAELRIASDWPEHVRWVLAQVRRHPKFEWTAERPRDWRQRPVDWPATRYEQKALEAGRTPAYLMFRRTA